MRTAMISRERTVGPLPGMIMDEEGGKGNGWKSRRRKVISVISDQCKENQGSDQGLGSDQASESDQGSRIRKGSKRGEKVRKKDPLVLKERLTAEKHWETVSETKLVKSRGRVQLAKVTPVEELNPRNPIGVFCEKVSVVGLLEAYETKIMAERIMWCVAFSAACVGMIISGYNTAVIYGRQTMVHIDRELLDDQPAPFPNVTICSPGALDRDKLRRALVIPQKVEQLLIRYGLVREQIIQETVDYWQVFSTPPNLTIAYIVTKIIDETVPLVFNGTTSRVVPGCPEIISDCSFNNIPFNCCHSAKRVNFESSICYHIHLDGRPDVLGSWHPIPDLTRHRSGLLINVAIDRRKVVFTDGLSNNGFHIHVGPMASPLSDPISIPSNMDAIIALKPPVLVQEKHRCRTNTGLPSMRYFQYYDPYGIRCTAEAFLTYIDTVLGCLLPGLDYVMPSERMCKREALYAINNVVSGDAKKAVVDKTMRKDSDLSLMKALHESSCDPLCTRWSYSVLSTSYAAIRYQNEPPWSMEDTDSNITWSRIRVYFPLSSSRVHQEDSLFSTYIIFGKIGSTLSGYAGMSIITFAEIIAYGVTGICAKKWTEAKKRIRLRYCKGENHK